MDENTGAGAGNRPVDVTIETAPAVTGEQDVDVTYTTDVRAPGKGNDGKFVKSIFTLAKEEAHKALMKSISTAGDGELYVDAAEAAAANSEEAHEEFRAKARALGVKQADNFRPGLQVSQGVPAPPPGMNSSEPVSGASSSSVSSGTVSLGGPGSHATFGSHKPLVSSLFRDQTGANTEGTVHHVNGQPVIPRILGGVGPRDRERGEQEEQKTVKLEPKHMKQLPQLEHEHEFQHWEYEMLMTLSALDFEPLELSGVNAKTGEDGNEMAKQKAIMGEHTLSPANNRMLYLCLVFATKAGSAARAVIQTLELTKSKDGMLAYGRLRERFGEFQHSSQKFMKIQALTSLKARAGEDPKKTWQKFKKAADELSANSVSISELAGYLLLSALGPDYLEIAHRCDSMDIKDLERIIVERALRDKALKNSGLRGAGDAGGLKALKNQVKDLEAKLAKVNEETGGAQQNQQQKGKGKGKGKNGGKNSRPPVPDGTKLVAGTDGRTHPVQCNNPKCKKWGHYQDKCPANADAGASDKPRKGLNGGASTKKSKRNRQNQLQAQSADCSSSDSDSSTGGTSLHTTKGGLEIGKLPKRVVQNVLKHTVALGAALSRHEDSEAEGSF